MSALFFARLTVPRSALPVDGVLGRILVETFPPDGVVVKVKRNVCENGILSCRGKRVGIGLLVRAGGNAEETVLGVDSIKSAVGTLSDPGDVVADAPDLVALVSVSLGRDKHGKVGLAAGGRECRADIFDFALRILEAEDKHMLSLPALFPALIGSYTKSKALLAEEDVSAVSGVDGDDGVILRELADITLLGVDVAAAVQSANPVVAVAQSIHNLLADSRHDSHVENDIDGVGQLNANLRERRADRTHRIRDNIHCSALIAVSGYIVEHLISLNGIHPVVGRTCLIRALGADECAVLNTRNIVGLGSVKQASGEEILVELGHLAGLACLGAQSVKLLLAAVDPHDFVGRYKSYLLFDPVDHCLVLCQMFHDI